VANRLRRLITTREELDRLFERGPVTESIETVLAAAEAFAARLTGEDADLYPLRDLVVSIRRFMPTTGPASDVALWSWRLGALMRELNLYKPAHQGLNESDRQRRKQHVSAKARSRNADDAPWTKKARELRSMGATQRQAAIRVRNLWPAEFPKASKALNALKHQEKKSRAKSRRKKLE
jgi:hypothetical protein